MGGREVGALSNMLAAHLDWDRPGDLDLLRRFWGVTDLPARPGLKAVDLFRAIGAGTVRAVWIIGTNPAVSLPRGGAVRDALAGCPFVVVSDCAADIWRHELAGTEPLPQALALLNHRLGVDHGWLRLDGATQGQHRAVLVRDGVVQAALFLTTADDLPPRAWLVRQCAPQTRPTPRLALLAGALPGGAAASPTICVCHGIDTTSIRTAIAAGCATQAGTGCGSCKPEIRAMLADVLISA